MGKWTLVIQGEGAHHSPEVAPGRPFEQDADQLAKQFVGKLKEMGQTVQSATFEQEKAEGRVVVILEGDPLEAPAAEAAEPAAAEPAEAPKAPQTSAAKPAAAVKAKAPAKKASKKKGKK